MTYRITQEVRDKVSGQKAWISHIFRVYPYKGDVVIVIGGGRHYRKADEIEPLEKEDK